MVDERNKKTRILFYQVPFGQEIHTGSNPSFVDQYKKRRKKQKHKQKIWIILNHKIHKHESNITYKMEESLETQRSASVSYVSKSLVRPEFPPTPSKI